MLITIEGKYADGHVSLAETPAGIQESRVFVTFVPESDKNIPSSQIVFGMFKGPRTTEPEDFKLAEWREEVDN